MDETRPTSAQASTDHHRLGGLVQSAILMAGCAVMTLPIFLWGESVFLTLAPAVIFLVFFTFVFVPLVWMEIFGPDEPARRRSGQKVLMDLTAFYTGLGRILRPVLNQFSWWRPLRLGRLGEAVLLPDSMAVFGLTLAFLLMATMELVGLSLLVRQPVPSFWLCLLQLLMPAVLVSPFVLTAVLLVSREEVRLIRFFVVIPYWVHHVPHDAELDVDDGPLAFTSRSRIRLDDRLFAFISRSRTRYELQLGTSTSALPLCRHISDVFERTGWKAHYRGVCREY